MPPKKSLEPTVAKVVQKRTIVNKWTDEESMTLLEQIIIHKDQISDSWSPVVTKESRKATWGSIADLLKLEHPTTTPKDVEAIIKRFRNLEYHGKIAIRNHQQGLTETGGGPATGPLRPLYQKYWEEFLGLNNPTVAISNIEGAVDSENAMELAEREMELQEQQHTLAEQILGRSFNPEDEFDSNSQDSQFEMDSHANGSLLDEDVDGSHSDGKDIPANGPATSVTTMPVASTSAAPVRGKSSASNPAKNAGPTPARATSTPVSVLSIMEAQKRNAPLSQRATLKRTKFKLCETSEKAAESRAYEARLQVLGTVMNLREQMVRSDGCPPFKESDIPDDLHDILFNPHDNV